MRALVTGAAGFVGSHMVDLLLQQGYEVVALDHRLAGKCLSHETLARVTPVEIDIRDAAAVLDAAANCGAIFHFAAVVGVEAYNRQADLMAEVERQGTHNVLRAAQRNSAAVVYASSSAVYGNCTSVVGHRENQACPPGSNYATVKLDSEHQLEEAARASGIRATALRIFNVYGPRQDERLVVPRFVRLARAGEPIVIYGDGTQTRDFVFVGDVVELALAAAKLAPGFEILNASTGVETSVRGLAEAIVSLACSASDIELRPQPTLRSPFEVDRSFGCIEKVRRFLPRPLVQLGDGLAVTMGLVP